MISSAPVWGSLAGKLPVLSAEKYSISNGNVRIARSSYGTVIAMNEVTRLK
jgi:hypothetical protein